jgi:hypothetical protein
MSLLDQRRQRKDLAGDNPSRPPRMWRLLLALAAVLYLIWFLGQRS